MGRSRSERRAKRRQRAILNAYRLALSYGTVMAYLKETGIVNPFLHHRSQSQDYVEKLQAGGDIDPALFSHLAEVLANFVNNAPPEPHILSEIPRIYKQIQQLSDSCLRNPSFIAAHPDYALQIRVGVRGEETAQLEREYLASNSDVINAIRLALFFCTSEYILNHASGNIPAIHNVEIARLYCRRLQQGEPPDSLVFDQLLESAQQLRQFHPALQNVWDIVEGLRGGELLSVRFQLNHPDYILHVDISRREPRQKTVEEQSKCRESLVFLFGKEGLKELSDIKTHFLAGKEHPRYPGLNKKLAKSDKELYELWKQELLINSEVETGSWESSSSDGMPGKTLYFKPDPHCLCCDRQLPLIELTGCDCAATMCQDCVLLYFKANQQGRIWKAKCPTCRKLVGEADSSNAVRATDQNR